MEGTENKQQNKGKNKPKGKGVGGNGNLIPVKKGEVRNPNGRPKGQRDYITIYREALKKLALSVGKEPEELEEEILQKGLSLARKGDYRFYKDLQDRAHGSPKQSVDVTSGGKELPVPIMQIGTGNPSVVPPNDSDQKDSQSK